MGKFNKVQLYMSEMSVSFCDFSFASERVNFLETSLSIVNSILDRNNISSSHSSCHSVAIISQEGVNNSNTEIISKRAIKALERTTL